MSFPPVTTLSPLSAVWDGTKDRWVPGNGDSWGASFSADGRLIAFVSDALNLAPADVDFETDLFIRVVGRRENLLLVPSAAGGDHDAVRFSPLETTTLVLRSTSTNLPGAPSGPAADLFLARFTIDDRGQLQNPSFVALTQEADATLMDFDGGAALFSTTRQLTPGHNHLGYGLFVTGAVGQAPQLIASSAEPFGRARFALGGDGVAFDTLAATVDINQDRIGDVSGSDVNGVSDVFFVSLDRSGLPRPVTVQRVTSDGAGNAPAVAASYLTDVFGNSLLLESRLLLSGGLPAAAGQDSQFRVIEARHSDTAPLPWSWQLRDSVASGQADAGPLGLTYVRSTDVVLDAGTGPTVLTRAAPPGSAGTHRAPLLGPVVANPQMLGAYDSDAILPARTVVFETTATNLDYDVAVATGPQHRQLVVATHGAQPVTLGRTVVDYIPGGRLNPFDANGLPRVGTVQLDVFRNELTEWQGDVLSPVVYSGPASSRLGPISPLEGIVLVANVPTFVSLGLGDDLVTVTRADGVDAIELQGDDRLLNLPAARLMGNIGFGERPDDQDILLVPAATSLLVTAGLHSLEVLQFAPANEATDVTLFTWAPQFSQLALGALPFSTIAGSAGVDVLRITPYYSFNGFERALDLDLGAAIAKVFAFGDGRDRIEVEGWAGSVKAAPGVPLYVFGGAVRAPGPASKELEVFGGDANDRVMSSEFNSIVKFDGGKGDDTLVASSSIDTVETFTGGDGSDTVDYSRSQGPVVVNLVSRNGTGNAAEGDTYDEVENVVGSAHDDTLTGNSKSNLIDGGAGQDKIHFSAGQDIVIGGSGLDTLYLPGKRDDYSILGTSETSIVVSDLNASIFDRTVVDDVELLVFADGIFTLGRLAGNIAFGTDATAVLDFGIGGLHNPLDKGLPTYTEADIDLPGDRLTLSNEATGLIEFDSVSQRLGRPLFQLPNNLPESALVTPAAGGFVLLHDGNDTVIGDDVAMKAGGMATEAFIAGGDGIDTVGALSGLTNRWWANRLDGFEQLQFDPTATPQQLTTLQMQVPIHPFGLYQPVWTVIGSPGEDLLRWRFESAAGTSQDVGIVLSNIAYQGLGGSDRVQVRFDANVESSFVNLRPQQGPSPRFDVTGTSGRDVINGGPDADLLQGQDGDDRLFGGGGDDQLYGGGGDDLLSLDGSGAAEGGPAFDTLQVPGRRSEWNVLPDRPVMPSGTQADVVLEGSGLYAGMRFTVATVERFRFSDGDATLVDLQAQAQQVLVSIDDAAGVLSVDEGSPPQAGGVLQVRLVRTGDLSLPVSGTWRLVPDPQAGPALSDDDLAGPVLGAALPFDFAGQRAITVSIPLRADTRWELDEAVRFELATVVDGLAGLPSSAVLWAADDDPFNFTLQGAARVAEGALFELVISPVAGQTLGDVERYEVNWGDGSTATFTAAQVVQQQGRLEHVYADGGAGGTPRQVSVVAVSASGLQAPGQATVQVDDVAPQLDASGPTAVNQGQPYTLQLGNYLDPGSDPLLGLSVDWGDGSPLTALGAAPPASLQHVFAGPGTHRIRVVARNDDGSFEVDRHDARVMPPAGSQVMQFVGFDPTVTMYEGVETVGRLRVERFGDVSQPAVVWLNVMPHPDPAMVPKVDAALDRLAGNFLVAFQAHQTVGVASIRVDEPIFLNDGLDEGVEWAQVSLQSAGFGTIIGPSSTASVRVMDLPLPPMFVVAPPASVFEGNPATLELHTTRPFPEATALQVDWGDGSPVETLPIAAGQLGAAGRISFSHVFADAPSGGRDVAVGVRVTGPGFDQSFTELLRVDDLPPRLDASGPGWVESGTPYVLNLGPYADVAGDPLTEVVLDWGDGSPLVRLAGPLPPTLTHAYPAQLADYTITVLARNDDGEHPVDTQAVNVVARLGGTTANSVPAFQAAWTDALVAGITHKADWAAAAAETPVTLSTVNSGVLAGGDIFVVGGRGTLGVSGVTQAGSSVRQAIDGTEALIIDLVNGQLANRIVADLALFQSNDHDGALRESMRVLLYRDDALVGEAVRLANSPTGRQRVTVDSALDFDRVVFQAGARDNSGTFVPGAGLQPVGGAFVAPSLAAASEFLLDGVTFMHTDDPIGLVGLPTYGP